MLGTRMTTLAFLLLDLSPLLLFKFEFVSSLQLEYPSQYFMILGRNVEQGKMTCWYKNDNSGFLSFGLICSSFV